MSSALDVFRAQKDAVDAVYARVTEVDRLIRELQARVDAITNNADLRSVLAEERYALERAARVVADVRRLREEEMRRFWPGVCRRWAVALVFALAASAAFGAGYVWASRPYAGELTELRSRVELLDFIAHRVIKMTPAERREFDALMKFNDAHEH